VLNIIIIRTNLRVAKAIWDFKEEAIKYCSIDCISLFQILSKFNQLIFDHFKINITKYPTLFLAQQPLIEGIGIGGAFSKTDYVISGIDIEDILGLFI
jgi:hypothetical protein